MKGKINTEMEFEIQGGVKDNFEIEKTTRVKIIKDGETIMNRELEEGETKIGIENEKIRSAEGNWEALYMGIKEYINDIHTNLQEFIKRTLEENKEIGVNDLENLLDFTHQVATLKYLKDKMERLEKKFIEE